MYLLLLYLPLLNFLILSLFGRKIGFKGISFLSIINLFFTTLFSYIIFYEVLLKGSICYFKLLSWFNLGLLNISWGFLFDPITASMLIVINTISFLVHIYSIGYMSSDPFNIRFISYLSLFTWFMLILVTGDNLLQLFLGWEGVGLVSYLLINFWFTILEANKSSIKAIIMNRIGDIGLCLSLCLIFFEYKSLDYNIIFPLIDNFKNDFFLIYSHYYNISFLIVLFTLIGAIGKSAQLGLHTWLPDAMAGPTPVSALIHAATMVTAGVFIIIKISPIVESSYYGLYIISIIGIITSFFSATIGLFQSDCKKIIAYSTCSQLGYMIFICGLSNFSLSLFHLTNHAFFKALLFLGAGSIIHSMFNEQDIRKFGGLIKILPFNYIIFLIGSLSLMGIPFLTGFYSKDLIIEIAYTSYFLNNSFIYWLSVLSAIFTSLYSFRLLFLTFYLKPNSFKYKYKLIKDSDFFLGLPLLILSFNSIIFGYFFKEIYIGLGSDIWLNSIIIFSSKNLLILEAEFLPYYIKNIPFIFSILGILLIILINSKVLYFWISFSYKQKKLIIIFYNFFFHKWYIDILYNKIFLKYFKLISYNNLKFIDRGFLEIIGPLGIIRFINEVINIFNNFIQTSLLYNYIFIFIIFLFFIFLRYLFYYNFLILDTDIYIFIFVVIYIIKYKRNDIKI